MSYGLATAQRSEAERLKALLEYEILDTPPDPAFDEIVNWTGVPSVS